MSRFLIEDDWRSPLSTHPLRPRPHKAYPWGKQVFAQMPFVSNDMEAYAACCLDDLQAEATRRVQEQIVERAICDRRALEASRSPVAVVPPSSSLPTVERAITELERRTLLTIEEIRGTFRQGRRSAAQKATRERDEDAIRAMVKHYRIQHPVLASPEKYGLRQRKEARREWREFAGSSLRDHINRQIAFEIFGEGDADDDGEAPQPADHSFDNLARKREIAETSGDRADEWLRDNDPDYHMGMRRESPPRRAARSQNRPQIVDVLARALDVDARSLRTVLAKTSTRTGVRTRGNTSDPAAPHRAAFSCA